MISYSIPPGNLGTVQLYEVFSFTVNVSSDIGTITGIIVTPDVIDTNVIITTDNQTFFTIAGQYITVLGGFSFTFVPDGESDLTVTPTVEADPELIPLEVDIFKYTPSTLQQRTINFDVEIEGTDPDMVQYDIIVFNNWDVGRDILLDLLADRV